MKYLIIGDYVYARVEDLPNPADEIADQLEEEEAENVLPEEGDRLRTPGDGGQRRRPR